MVGNSKSGALNLLTNCLNVQAGESVLLVLEPTDTLYDTRVAAEVSQCLVDLGAFVTTVDPPLICDPADFPDNVTNAIQGSDHTIFLSRIGDYVRFLPLPGNGSRVTSYTLDIDILGAPYATVNSRLLHQLQLKLEAHLMQADQWRIQCPLGTDLSGSFCWPSLSGGDDADLTVRLFPVATFKPVPCDNSNGQVALSRWLMPGGAAKLDDADLSIDGVVYAHVKNGCLDNFTGENTQVEKLNRHYDYVSNTLNISRNRIHSWHAGMNPQTTFSLSADDHLDLWSATSFGSPRYLHFHTCGDEPPGEIAWSVFNPTITIDDTLFWSNGEFVWLQQADNKALIEAFDGAHYLLEPSLPIGID